ncbi:hypothetical protein [Lactococcus cremoris]|nr:hypothetical protein [Lactococcus cremoris]
MAFMVARTEKRKIGSLGGYQNHVDRKTDNHSNWSYTIKVDR